MAKNITRTTFTIRLDEKVAGKVRGATKALDTTIGELLEPVISAHLKELEAKTGKRFKILPSRPMKKAA